jgi:hypothetical protein
MDDRHQKTDENLPVLKKEKGEDVYVKRSDPLLILEQRHAGRQRFVRKKLNGRMRLSRIPGQKLWQVR